MPVRLHKKLVIWIGSIALLTVALIIIFIFLLKNYPHAKEQYKVEKRLSEIFVTLDSSYWKNNDNNLLLTNEAILIS